MRGRITRAHKSSVVYYYYYYYYKQSRVNSDAAQVLASSPKDVLKSTVFSCRKAASDCSSLTKEGREFVTSKC